MKISDFMTGNFSVIDAAWTRKHALDATSELESGYVIVRKAVRGHSAVDFYLLALDEYQKRMSDSRAGRIARILNLAALDPAPTFAHNAILRAMSSRGVVLAGDEPVGVFEPSLNEQATRGGLDEFLQYESYGSDDGSAGHVATGHVSSGHVARGSARDDSTGDGDSGSAGDDAPPGSAGDGSPDREAAVKRYLIGELPSTVKLREPIKLAVKLTATSASGSNVAGFKLPPGTKVDIIVNPVERLRVVGRSTVSLEVQDPQLDQSYTFELAAEETGLGRVEVCAFHNVCSIATLLLETEIVEALPATPPRADQPTAPLTIGRREPPDLALFIFERDKEIRFYLQSADGAYTMNEFGPITLQTPREYFQDFFRTIENLPLDTPDDRKKAKERLGEQGLDLFGKAVPADLQEVLWKLRDRVRTLQINSDEPWIPWEVCKLQGVNDDGRIEEGPFFAEAFSVTRWFRGVPAVTRLSLNKLALVVPDDSGLAKAPDEKKFMHGLKGDARTVVDIAPTVHDVKQAMATGKYDAWHFTGHARASVTVNADQSAIELNKREPFTPAQIVGVTQNLLQSQPFVFLNACQSAQGGMSLTGAGGWAQRLIKVKPSASAFIGTYWSVDDETAFEFAKQLYGSLLGGSAIGEAAKDARLAIKAQDDPAWLAYTVYADPFATVV